MVHDIEQNLAQNGLRILHVGPDRHFGSGGSVLIVGHGGSAFWPFFQASGEYADGQPDPLDRWSRRVISAAAPDLRFVSPNDGPPYPPIHALAAGGSLHPSPLGMLAHIDFGLWSAVRGLLISDRIYPPSPAQPAPDPAVFADCFAACPVSAFSDDGYDARACARHLLAHKTAPCWQGCLARKACTLGANQAYQPSHARFYMDTFTKAMEQRGL